MARTKLHWDILDKKRRALLPKLKFLKERGFYLAGGTALALQIRHRISVDFDFYNPKEFDAEKIYGRFQKQNLSKLLLDTMADNTLILETEGVGISFFAYNYPQLKPLIDSEYLRVASLEDIAAMKLVAIIQRGVKRDFIDIYFMMKQLGLEKMLSLAKKKYKGFNEYLALQALVYFHDAEEKQSRETKLLLPVHWDEIKQHISKEVEALKNKWTKK